MVVLLVIAASLVLLYVWLTGHWFGRVMAFLAFIAPCALIWANSSLAHAWVADLPETSGLYVLWALVLLGPSAFAAWLIASVPIGYRNWRARQMLVISRRTVAQPDAAYEAPDKPAHKRLVGPARVRIDPVF